MLLPWRAKGMLGCPPLEDRPCGTPPEAQQAEEVARLAGGASALVARARELLEAGDLRLACHLIEWAFQAAPEDKATNEVRAEIYGKRAEQERALMTSGVFRWTERESRELVEG